MRILFVDDDTDLVALLCHLYSNTPGVVCETAASFAEACAVVEKSKPFDLFILDINLGAGAPDGLDFHRWLRDRGVEARVVFLTGHAKSDPQVRQASELEGSLVLEKPAEISTLRSLLVELPR